MTGFGQLGRGYETKWTFELTYCSCVCLKIWRVLMSLTDQEMGCVHWSWCSPALSTEEGLGMEGKYQGLCHLLVNYSHSKTYTYILDVPCWDVHWDKIGLQWPLACYKYYSCASLETRTVFCCICGSSKEREVSLNWVMLQDSLVFCSWRSSPLSFPF